MAHFEKRKKRVVLRTVEDEPREEDRVIRLGPEKEKNQEDEMPTVRLGPMRPPEPASGAAVPSSEFRTHQPGIEALIELPDAAANPEEMESGWGARRLGNRPVPWGWFVLLGGLFTTAVVWSTWSVKKAEREAELARHQVPQSIIDEHDKQQEAEKLVAEVETAVRSYFASGSVDTRARWVRQRTRVEPLMRGAAPEEPRQVRWVRLQSLEIGPTDRFWAAGVMLANGQRKQLIVEITPEGPKIDWETLVCHQPMDWDAFAQERPQGKSMDFRVHVTPDVFHSHEFADESQWACYRLTTFDSKYALFGYVRHGSETHTALAALTAGLEKTSVILRLQIPVGLKSPQGVVIERLMSNRWLYLDPPKEP